MPKLRLIKDDPSTHDIIPFPAALGGRIGARLGRVSGAPTTDLEHELMGTIDRMQRQLGQLSDMIGPYPLYPEDDRPTAA